MSISQYQTVSWNIGCVADFIGLYRRAKQQPWENLSSVPGLRMEKLKEVFKRIADDKKPDIFFLQEVGEEVHAGLKKWLENYAIHFDGDDTLVAWNKERFTEILGSRQSEQLCKRFSIVDLMDKTAKKVVRIASIHLHGYDLSQPERERCGRRVTESGDEELREIVKLLLDCSERIPELIMLGMDANSTPDIHPERLEILESERFVRDFDDNQPTAFNPTLDHRKAKIDFIYAKCISGKCNVLESSANLNLKIESPDTNPSDHRPLYQSIVIN